MKKDYLTEPGAKILMYQIKLYWEKRGFFIKLFYKRGPYMKNIKSGVVQIRSNMINGLPVDWKERQVSDKKL